MSSEPDSADRASGDSGVFGNLPSERPGVRSPRRSGEKRASGGKGPRAKAGAAKPAPRSPSSRPRPKPSPPRERVAAKPSSPDASAEAPPEPAAPGKGIEEVAWAGVTVAAEAATLGVRLLSRALEAVRERR